MRAWRGCLVKEKILEVVDLCKEYPVKRGALLPKEIGMVHAVNHVSFTLYQGETLGIIGESGCGKTTLIRMLMGLEEATGGYVQFGDKKIHRHMPPLVRKNMQMVFQDPTSSFNPKMKIRDIICEPLLNFGRIKKSEKEENCRRLLELVELPAEFSDRYPHNMSGGQRQRVAIARALVNRPKVLLLDEPLGALDLKLRKEMQQELKYIQQEVGITAIYVTHDQSEAMALSDRIIIMRSGVVEQIGSPQEIYYHPVNEFVADFIGEANFLKGRLEALSDNRAQLNVSGDICHAAPVPGMEVGRDYTIVLRPEAASLAEEGGLPCEVVLSCFMGSYQNYHVKVGDTLVKLTDPNPKNKRIYKVGERCHLVFDPESVHVL